MPKSKKVEPKKVPGDKFILCTFPLMYRGAPSVDDSDNSLGELLSRVPQYITDEGTYSVCRVAFWVESSHGGIDSEPGEWKTILTITADDLEAADEDEEEGASVEEKVTR